MFPPKLGKLKQPLQSLYGGGGFQQLHGDIWYRFRDCTNANRRKITLYLDRCYNDYELLDCSVIFWYSIKCSL